MDVKIIKNNKLRKLLKKGPNIRELQSINLSEALSERNKEISSSIENMTTKSKIDIELFRNWKVKSLAKIQEKIIKLKQKVKPKGVKSVLNNPEFKIYLEQLSCQFFIVAIDKASNNFACFCKKYYMTKPLHENSINGGTPNKT